MFCPKCGKEVPENASFCPECGCDLRNNVAVVEEKPQQRATSKTENPLQLIAFILMLITTIACGFALIPLAWMIPMTVHCYRCMENNEKASIGFGVCTLIFVNLVSGILLLIDTTVEQ